ncbi:MAG: protocatechuate 3,4-dioxygenase subunit alpha [Devosia sp.]
MSDRKPILHETPSQTAGPYVHVGLVPSHENINRSGKADFGVGPVPAGNGPPIIVTGRLIDGAGAPITDAVVELWQADTDGIYRQGFGRSACDADGRYRFDTVKPGRIPGQDGSSAAPHLTLWIVARGINIGLHTRLYFGDEAEANATDPVLAQIADPARRATLIASPSDAGGKFRYSLDIRLQGAGETVFFDI